MVDLRKLTRKFIQNEGRYKEPSLRSCLQALEETIAKFSPRSQSDSRRLEVVKEQVRGIKRHFRRLEEENTRLQEQISVLEESKEEK